MVPSSSITCVITGGGSGFGRQQALALHQELGATVILVGRRSEPLKQVQSELQNDRCHVIAGDVSTLETWKAIRDKIEHELGGELHFLGNNAAAPDPRSRFRPIHPPSARWMLLQGASYNLYKDQNVLSFGINPVAYDTPILSLACANLKLDNVGVLAERYNPFPVIGNPKHVGELSVTLMKDPTWLEPGCSYNMLPLTAELSSTIDINDTQSLLMSTDYAATMIHSTDMLAQLRGWAKMEKGFDQKGKELSEAQMERIRAALRAKINDSSS